MYNDLVARLTLSLLGVSQIALEEQPITHFRSINVQGILIYLALQPSKPVSREVLATLFWPDETERRARANLRQSLYQLRKLLGDIDNPDRQFLLITRSAVQLNPDGDYEVDVHEFLTAIEKRDLETAVSIYQGELLPGFSCGSVQFEDWLRLERQSLHRLALATMYELTHVYLHTGRLDSAQAIAHRQLGLEPWHEPAHRQLMRAYALAGDRANALAQYEACRKTLHEELGITPAPETTTLFEDIKSGRFGATTTEWTIQPPRRRKHNLPAETAPLIGRALELEQIRNLFTRYRQRLVTIVGPGGVGKTRLALAAGYALLEQYPDGVYFVDLAPLEQANEIPIAISTALDFQPPDLARDVFPQLLSLLCRRQILLILDNLEHLLDGVAMISEIMQACPSVAILVTSRQRLNMAIESRYELGGLEFPESLTPENALAYTAVQLFSGSGRRVRPDFVLNENNITGVIRICQLVQGMPLGLILAAAWLELLSPVEIAAEIEGRLGFLAADLADLPPRQRSMQAIFERSWGMLAPDEQTVLARLSIFHGGFTRDAAEQVAGANLRILLSLVSKSLLQRRNAGGRFEIHGLLRKYGAEKLAEDWERETAARQQHSHFYCATLQKREADLKSVRQQTALAKIEADYQNIVAAWNEALSQGHLTQLVDAVNGLGEFYDAAGRWREGVATLENSAEKVQAVFGETPTTAMAARLLVWLWAWRVNLSSTFSVILGGPSERPLVQHFLQPGWDLLAHPVLADLDTRAEKAFVQLLFGRILFWSAQYEKGQEYLTASLNLYRTLNDDFHLAEALRTQYLYATVEDKPEQGYRLLKESLALFRQVGESRRIVATLCFLVRKARDLTAFAEAGRYLDEAFTIARAATNHLGTIETHLQATDLAWYRGQFDLALTHNKKAFVWAETMNNPVMLGACAGSMAVTRIYHGQFSQAISLFQEAAELNPDNWTLDMQPMAHVHAGDYETAESLLIKGKDDISFFPWVRLTQANYAQALSLAQQRYDQFPLGEHEHRAWVQVPMAYALYKLDRVAEARQTLYQCLQTCLAIQAFLPLMQVMPIIPVLLAEEADERLKERAVELYVLAESLPFVGKSHLFADLAGKPMAAVHSALPANVVPTAQARGRELDWWQTAESLLTELTELGWGEEAEEQDSRAA